MEKENTLKNEILENMINKMERVVAKQNESSTLLEVQQCISQIECNKTLIEKACTDWVAFDSLVRSIYRLAESLFGTSYTDFSRKNAFKSDLYKEVEKIWNYDNLFDATLLNMVKFAICQKDCYDQ